MEEEAATEACEVITVADLAVDKLPHPGVKMMVVMVVATEMAVDTAKEAAVAMEVPDPGEATWVVVAAAATAEEILGVVLKEAMAVAT